MTDKKNPFEAIQQAEIKYLEQFKEFSEAWGKMHEYIKPFIQSNPEYTEISSKLNALLVAMPVAHIVITELHMTNVKLMRDMMKAQVPPLKIDCPDCKKTVWDVTELKSFLDPEGNIYGDKQ